MHAVSVARPSRPTVSLCIFIRLDLRGTCIIIIIMDSCARSIAIPLVHVQCAWMDVTPSPIVGSDVLANLKNNFHPPRLFDIACVSYPLPSPSLYPSTRCFVHVLINITISVTMTFTITKHRRQHSFRLFLAHVFHLQACRWLICL